MPVVRARAGFRGLGQACQYKISGVTPDPTIPICSGPYQMTPAQIASVQAAQLAGGYSDTTAPGSYTGAFAPGQGPSANIQLAPYTGGSYAGPQPTQSNAPNAVSTVVPAAPVQSNAPNQVVSTSPLQSWTSLFGGSSSPVATPAGACFSLFQGEACIGPIGSTTLLAVGGGLLALFFLFGSHR